MTPNKLLCYEDADNHPLVCVGRMDTRKSGQDVLSDVCLGDVVSFFVDVVGGDLS